MPRRKPFKAWSYLHVYNRGFHKQQLFFDKDDYEYFRNLFTKHLKKYTSISLIEHCLLPNHFHFVFLNKRYWFDVSNLIGKVLAGYSKYFERHCWKEKWMKLLEGPYKVKFLNNESYLNKCKFYVRYNAIKHGLVEDMKNWSYSSFKHKEVEKSKQSLKLIIKHFSQELEEDFEYEWEKGDGIIDAT